jgi:uroporphyrinogen-III synthase
MHVLITRPERDATDLKSRIVALGCEVTLAPLLDIQFKSIALEALSDAAGVVATSRNGLQALARSAALPAALTLPVFTVGPATTRLARELGFATVISGPGTAAELVPVIAGHSAAQSGPLVHLAGDHLAFDLVGTLSAHGITVKAVEAYASVAAKTLSGDVVSLLTSGRLDAVILMSPRSAAIWSALISALPVKPKLTKVTHICLSRAVAAKLAGISGLQTVIAEKPNADEIVSEVYRLAGRGGNE